MFKPSEEYTLEDCFEKLRCDYSVIKNENDRLKAYVELLQVNLEINKINYPSYDLKDESYF